MGKVQDDILGAFYEELAKSDAVDAAMVKHLREVFASGKTVKADDVVAIFTRKAESSPE